MPSSTHNTQTEMAPHPSRGLTSVALWRTVCLCARLNNLTRAIPPLLLCLITPCTLSVLSRGRKRDRIDFKQHLGGAGGGRGGARLEWGWPGGGGRKLRRRKQRKWKNGVEGGGRQQYWRSSDKWRISGSTMSSELLLPLSQQPVVKWLFF